MALIALIAWMAPGGLAIASQTTDAEPDAREIARRAEDAMRSDSTYLAAAMTVRSPRLSSDRVVRFRSWDDRPGKRNMIRILSPAKDEGSGFLKLHPNLWMYVPRVERTMRIPPSMMLQPWMGSDLTNDDLVNESSEIDDYEHVFLRIDDEVPGAAGRSAYVIEYTPHEDAPVVWGKIRAWIDQEHYAPLRQEFFDERGSKIRVMSYSDLRKSGDRHFPHRWRVTPLEKPGHETEIQIEEVRFDQSFDDGIFTKRNLKKAR